MQKYKKHLILSSIYIFLYILINLIYYLSNININIINTLILILNLSYIGIISYNIAKKNNNKGIVIGCIITSVIIAIIFILSLILKIPITYKTIIYYTLILLVSTMSSIISKNVKK